MVDFISENKEIFIAALSSAIALVTILYPMWRKEHIHIWEERYYKVIFPIYDLLEPYLYNKETPKHIIDEMMNILNHNRAIAGSKLLYLASMSYDDYDNYKKVCSHISYHYDKLCIFLHLPKRTISYILQRKQYADRSSRNMYRILRVLRVILIIELAFVAIILLFLLFLLLLAFFNQ
ncbi:MAG: hypothetical protein LBR74_05640 [Eubacterium sp.]|jgi:hypothetical protein|nr:hypothetical protein [Eubacterium sp.]